MNESPNPQYVALLRGINVGGHKKVLMTDLKEIMQSLGFNDVKTLLNSGNVVFTGKPDKTSSMEQLLTNELEQKFGFPVPVLVRNAEEFKSIIDNDPFEGVKVHKDIRLYITFLKTLPAELPEIPWKSNDGAFIMLSLHEHSVASVLDLSKTKTVEGMKILEQSFGKDITTRNWNTTLKIGKLLH